MHSTTKFQMIKQGVSYYKLFLSSGVNQSQITISPRQLNFVQWCIFAALQYGVCFVTLLVPIIWRWCLDYLKSMHCLRSYLNYNTYESTFPHSSFDMSWNACHATYMSNIIMTFQNFQKHPLLRSTTLCKLHEFWSNKSVDPVNNIQVEKHAVYPTFKQDIMNMQSLHYGLDAIFQEDSATADDANNSIQL